MATLLQQVQLVFSSAFQQQLAGALMIAASEVIDEASSVLNHAQRLSYAQGIVGNPMLQAQIMAPGCLLNATIAGDAGGAVGASGTPVADADLQSCVSALYNTYSAYFVAMSNAGTMGPPLGTN